MYCLYQVLVRSNSHGAAVLLLANASEPGKLRSTRRSYVAYTPASLAATCGPASHDAHIHAGGNSASTRGSTASSRAISVSSVVNSGARDRPRPSNRTRTVCARARVKSPRSWINTDRTAPAGSPIRQCSSEAVCTSSSWPSASTTRTRSTASRKPGGSGTPNWMFSGPLPAPFATSSTVTESRPPPVGRSRGRAAQPAPNQHRPRSRSRRVTAGTLTEARRRVDRALVEANSPSARDLLTGAAIIQRRTPPGRARAEARCSRFRARATLDAPAALRRDRVWHPVRRADGTRALRARPDGAARLVTRRLEVRDGALALGRRGRQGLRRRVRSPRVPAGLR